MHCLARKTYRDASYDLQQVCRGAGRIRRRLIIILALAIVAPTCTPTSRPQREQEPWLEGPQVWHFPRDATQKELLRQIRTKSSARRDAARIFSRAGLEPSGRCLSQKVTGKNNDAWCDYMQGPTALLRVRVEEHPEKL